MLNPAENVELLPPPNPPQSSIPSRAGLSSLARRRPAMERWKSFPMPEKTMPDSTRRPCSTLRNLHRSKCPFLECEELVGPGAEAPGQADHLVGQGSRSRSLPRQPRGDRAGSGRDRMSRSVFVCAGARSSTTQSGSWAGKTPRLPLLPLRLRLPLPAAGPLRCRAPGGRSEAASEP